ncbi:hypothetical protein C8R47DRAFT_1148854 [Mycena vitilis]|nr:hypothetical protein C8R47DRAFT_1148854 [Mycena vitilis]
MNPSGKPKGTHGGKRKGAGRPPNPNKIPKLPPRTLGNVLRVAPSAARAATAPSAFFRPYNTHQAVPLSGSAASASVGPGPSTAFYSQRNAPGSDPQSTGISLNNWTRLNSEFNFVAENDEHADVAAGDAQIDDSLVKEFLDHMEPNSGTEEADTQPADAIKDSVLHGQLKSVKIRFGEEIAAHGKPLCYLRGDFFDRPPHPVFALEESRISTGLDPAKLYWRRIFVWLPYLLPGCPTQFLCPCGKVLTRNGFNDDPIARRVRDLPDDFFLFTNRFICDGRRLNDSGCGRSVQGTDPHILAQLPRQLQVAFPAYISARGAISKLMMRLMCNTFSTRMGPSPFSDMVAEIQYLSHADGELAYTATANVYGQTGLKQYSAFNDHYGYAGSPPSVPWLKGLFTDYMSAHRIYVERDTATKPATVVKADHTFDFLKYVGGLKGQPLFSCAYTWVNEHEEIRGHALAQSKSLEYSKDMAEGIGQGLKDSGNPPTQLFYTDSPQSERTFHEAINASLTKNVVPVTDWTDYPPFQVSSDIPAVSVSDSMDMEAAANEILQDFFAHSRESQLYLIVLAIKAENPPGKAAHLHVIQFRTRNKIYSFKVSTLTSPSDVLPSLRAVLTNTSIIKIGHEIRQTLRTISRAFSLPELEKTLASHNPPVLDLGKYAKLKGCVDTASVSLHALAGIVLHKSFPTPHSSPSQVFYSLPTSDVLFAEIDCLWNIYTSLSALSSVGLPLQPVQAKTGGQYVTLVQACKPIAEGHIIGHHAGYLDITMDAEGHTKKVNVSASRSLIQITKVLVPGAIHSLHKQTIEWIFAHGGKAVVTTSQLHSRSAAPPAQVAVTGPAFASPAPTVPSSNEEEFIVSPPMAETDALELHRTEDMAMNVPDDDDSDGDDFEFNATEFGEQFAFEAQQNPGDMDGIDSGINDNSSVEEIMAAIDQTWPILQQAAESETLPTRVLDDAFHYMDRLLRLLSKKHSAFKAFCHDFSEAIFIRDQSDEDAVRAVLEKHGVSWEYAKRAMAPALNRRIRRYIPRRDVLVRRVETLFSAYADIRCSTKKTRGSFFSDEAKEMAKSLLETARKGYLSDPPGIPLYYLMGTDRDGLKIYRTVRGTNSIEGGVHMVVRRIFGSLRASPELAECILINWILRRNTRVGFHNRTGTKYRGHFNLWVRDEIVELAVGAGLKPSFPLPRVLSTRIATSETIGILPVSRSVATSLNITTLPRPRITGVPHHRDTPVHALSRLCTKPTNIYRYIQMRQLTLAPVLPVHTHKEYIFFKEHVNNAMFRKGGRPHPPHEHHKNVDFLKFAQFWNIQVNVQSPAVIDSNQRLYYKIPIHLETHHKKSILLTSERSTLATGSNFTARKQFLDILTAQDNHAHVLPALPLPDGELDLSVGASNDPGSFDRMAVLPPAGGLEDTNIEEIEFTHTVTPAPIVFHNLTANVRAPIPYPSPSAPPPVQAPVQPPVQHGQHFWQTLMPGANQPSHVGPSKHAPRRCAACCVSYCEKRASCQGKGGQKYCRCPHPPLLAGQKVPSEPTIVVYLTQRAQGG